MAIPKKRKKHLIKRIKERVGTHICQSDLEDNLDHSKIMFAKKLTNSRSLAYIVINETPIKIIYSKECKKIITVLTINHTFEFPKYDYYYFTKNGNRYRMKIFPDAYMETENPKALTIFEIWDHTLDNWRTKKKSSKSFEEIFKLAWGFYEEREKARITTSQRN
jgi:hypothetical protein